MEVDHSEAIPLTPTSSDCSNDGIENDSLRTALHVLRTERDAITNLEKLYDSDEAARRSFTSAVVTISDTISAGGRIIITGVGKSGKVAQKCVATMNSLGIRSAYLHPTEALHGDLGMISSIDTIMILTYSGRTPEIMSLLPHVPRQSHRIVMTGQTDEVISSIYGLTAGLLVHLPTPLLTSEIQSFGMATPTSSTTIMLALTDALAIASARYLHIDPANVFQSYHPGGVIGANAAKLS